MSIVVRKEYANAPSGGAGGSVENGVQHGDLAIWHATEGKWKPGQAVSDSNGNVVTDSNGDMVTHFR